MLANLLLVSNKTLWSLWHFYNFSACWLFWCFKYPPNSDMDYIIFNVSMWYFCMRIHTEDLGLYLWSHIKDFCGICTESDSCEISGRAQSLARNGYPSIWWPHSTVFWNWLSRESALALRHCISETCLELLSIPQTLESQDYPILKRWRWILTKDKCKKNWGWAKNFPYFSLTF